MVGSSMRAGGIGGAMRSSAPLPAPPPQQEMANPPQPSRKIDPSLLAGKTAKVQVKIWLNDASPETLAELKKLGVVTVQQAGKLVIATVDTAKLLDVAKLAGVLYISPLT